MDQEGENDHLMKAVMRALNSAQEKVLPITQVSPRCSFRSLVASVAVVVVVVAGGGVAMMDWWSV